MGYRSDVAYVIKFKEPEQREAFINLVDTRHELVVGF